MEFQPELIHAWERKFRLLFGRQTIRSALTWRLKVSRYFIQEFNATNFSERNKNLEYTVL